MFTGIIEGLGTVTSVRPSGRGRHLMLTADFSLDQTKIGDSIAVNGACLTAVSMAERRFEVDVSSETLATTTLGAMGVGERVNLERAMRLTDRIDGHLVSGHIDGTGSIQKRTAVDNTLRIVVGVPETLSRYMIRKGSVAVDGISLTINDCGSDRFEVMIIPHTSKLTTLGFKKVGDAVNIETDVIGKYVERFVAGKQAPADETADKKTASSVDMQFLLKTGFL